jgi:hypothetical protein
MIDAQCLACEIEALKAFWGELPGARALDGLNQAMAEAEQQCEHVLGHRVLAVGGHVADPDTALGAIGSIYVGRSPSSAWRSA